MSSYFDDELSDFVATLKDELKERGEEFDPLIPILEELSMIADHCTALQRPADELAVAERFLRSLRVNLPFGHTVAETLPRHLRMVLEGVPELHRAVEKAASRMVWNHHLAWLNYTHYEPSEDYPEHPAEPNYDDPDA